MLDLKILAERYNSNGDKIYNFYVAPRDVVYVGYILESLEGWAFYTTIDEVLSIMHVEVIKDYVGDFEKFLGVLLNKRRTI